MKKGQASIELILLVSVALFLLTGFIMIEFIQTKDIISAKKRLGSEDIAQKLKTEISVAGRIKPYYSREFELPESIGGHEYRVVFGTNEIAIVTDAAQGESHVAKLIPVTINQVSIDGDVKPFPVTIGQGSGQAKVFRIEKTNVGEINLEYIPPP